MTPEIKNRIAQIRRGEVPEGYKKIKTIIIPSDWEIFPLRNVAAISSGSTPERKTAEYWNGDIPWINTSELSNTNIIKASEFITQAGVEAARLHMYLPGTILMAMYGQGKTRGTVARLGIEATINQACVALEVHERHVVDYVFLQLQHSYHDIRKLSNSGSQDNLNSKIIASFKVPIAVSEEQIKIAAIFATQDKVIELNEKRIAEKQRQKKYLVQQLLTGKKRLSENSAKWGVISLNQCSKKQKIKNVNFTYSLVFSNSAQKGIVPQDEQFDKEIANAENVDGYYIVNNGDFVYNPRVSVTAPCGPINMNETGRIGVMSPLYTVFSIDSDKVDAQFAKHYFKSTLWFRHVKSVANYGARHDRLSVNDDDFFAMALPLPAKTEQCSIASVLSVADREIDLLQKDLETEKQKKKALMQLLLTGIVRVKV